MAANCKIFNQNETQERFSRPVQQVRFYGTQESYLKFWSTQNGEKGKLQAKD